MSQFTEAPTPEYILSEVKDAQFRFDADVDEYINPNISIINGKFVAQQTIHKGTLLYSSLPCISYIDNISGRTVRVLCVLSQMEQDDLDKLNLLLKDHYPRTDDELKQVFSYMCPDHEYQDLPIVNIIDIKIKVTKFRKGNFGICVYGYGLMFSHSCNPNCFNLIRPDDSMINIYSIRDIQAGDDCTICFDHTVLHITDIDKRRSILRDSCYLYCSCQACNSSVNKAYYAMYVTDVMTTKHVWVDWLANK